MKKYIGYIIFGIIVLVLAGGYIYGNNVSISNENYLKLYEKIIDQVVASNVNEQYDYIAVDANSFNVGSVEQQRELAKYLSKYDKEIIIGSYNILKDDSHFVDSEGNLLGIVISAEHCKYQGNMITLDVVVQSKASIRKSYSFKATFMFNNWNLRNVLSINK